MRVGLFCIGLLAVLSLPAGGYAEENEGSAPDSKAVQEMRDLYGDEAFVTIATGSRKPVYKAPAVATVITADDIKSIGARNLNEILETVPGLHVSLSTLSRLDSVYSLRGIHTGFNPQVLLLMNGIPFPFLYTGGHPTLFRLPVSSISRVEVIRGPGSAVYGADAFAGVINVITKEAGEIKEAEVGARLGSFDTHDFWVLQGKNWGPWDIAFSLEWQESNGDKHRRVNSDLQSTLDSSLGTNASLAPGPLRTGYDVLDTHLTIKRDDWQLRNWYWKLDRAGQGAGGAQALDNRGSQNVDLYLADLLYRNNKILSDWDFAIGANYLYQKTDSKFMLLPPGTVVPLDPDGNLDFTGTGDLFEFENGVIGRPGATDRQMGVEFTAIYSGFANNRWRIGSGFKYQKEDTFEEKNYGPGVLTGILTDVSGSNFIFMKKTSRENWYLSLQDEWQFARDWELTAGVRYDDYSDFGNTVNPRLALVWTTLHNLTTKLLYGRAFRAPSFSELYAINNPVILGNSELDPETIDTFELSFAYRPIFPLQTNLSLFAYKAENLIQFVPDVGGTTNTAQNARDQEGYGLEFEMVWDVTESLSFNGNYALQHSEDVETGERTPDAPGQKIYLRADWKFYPNWTVHPQVTWVGQRKRAETDTRPEIDDYTIVDLVLRRQGIAGRYDVALAARNLLNEDAREPSDGKIPEDFPLEGRSIWGEIRCRF